MTIAAPRFAANIRFVNGLDWSRLKLDRSYGTPEVGRGCSWLAGDADQFLLASRVYTDCIGPCSAGGITGYSPIPTYAGLTKTGMFHLIPSRNLDDASQQVIVQRSLENALLLRDEYGGFVCGGHPERRSRQLSQRLVGWMGRILGHTPTHFTHQRDDAWSALGFIGALNTWFVRTQTMDHPKGLESIQAIRETFAKRKVAAGDRVYIGLDSTEPIPAELLEGHEV